jgi:hypothetical protein
MSWLDFLVYGVHRFIKAGVDAGRRAWDPKPCCHGVIGFCQSCDLEHEERIDEEFARSPMGLELARQERLIDIYEAYSAIDEATRTRLRAAAEERIQRLDLRVRAGDLEAAVVNMYRRSERNQSSK